MLLEFTAKNFLSIKDEITLSMIASKDQSLEDNLVPYIDGKKSKNILKSIVIYGANASGKTNLLKALGFFVNFIRESHEMQQGRKIKRRAFKLDQKCKYEPSDFKITFIHNEVKYLYGFSVTSEEVITEFLYYYPNGRRSIIFERTNGDNYNFTIDIERQTELKNKFHSKNKLFLATESLWEYEKAKIPFDWLSNNLQILIDHENLELYTSDTMDKDDSISLLVKKYIKFADLGIDDIKIKLEKANDILNLEAFKAMPAEIKSELIDKLDDSDIVHVKTIHSIKNLDGTITTEEFELSEESDGTIKFFGLLGPWIDCLRNGYTLVIDELDMRLHTLLVRKLIELFLDPDINKNNAQLIFTTHDTNLLDSDLLRRDQIWFTEKQVEDKSTDLYSLYDLNGIRKNISIQKAYLQGKFRAIPKFLGDFE